MLPIWYNDYKKFIEKSLFDYLDNYLDNEVSKPLEKFKKIIKYSVKWWKRIRAILSLEFYLVLSWKKIKDIKQDDDIIKLCIAIECVHAYSLVHDDLPCMDNDILRRWEETVWKKYWEYNWVLVWDLLNSFAFEVLSEIKDSNLSKKLTKLLSRSVWFYGMLWWQVEDLYFEENSKQLDIKLLKWLHNKKTGALIKASILWWIMLSWKQELVQDYISFWEKLWLAFQVKDDLLDVEWTIEETGKSVWWEEKGFVYFLWLEESKEKLFNLINDCKKLSKNLSSQKIDFIIDYIKNRKK